MKRKGFRVVCSDRRQHPSKLIDAWPPLPEVAEGIRWTIAHQAEAARMYGGFGDKTTGTVVPMDSIGTYVQGDLLGRLPATGQWSAWNWVRGGRGYIARCRQCGRELQLSLPNLLALLEALPPDMARLDISAVPVMYPSLYLVASSPV